MEYLIEVDATELSLIKLGLQHLTIATELAGARAQPAAEGMLAQRKTTRARIGAQADGYEAGVKGLTRPNPFLVGTHSWRCWQRAHARGSRPHPVATSHREKPIAAAAELLTALEELANAIGKMPAQPDVPGWGVVLANLLDARAVIAKAKGEAP